MAFWSKKDSDDEIRISKEEYEDLKKVEDKWLKLQAAIVTDERLIVLRSEYDQLKRIVPNFQRCKKGLQRHLNSASTGNGKQNLQNLQLMMRKPKLLL